eukprot:2262819-Rhodomonas_salina.1
MLLPGDPSISTWENKGAALSVSLRACCAMCGADMRTVLSSAMCGTEVGFGVLYCYALGMRCAVTGWHMVHSALTLRPAR